MIYEIVAGGIKFYTADTDLLDVDTGVYHGNVNLYVRRDYDRSEDETNNYIYPVSRTVYYRPDGNNNTQYLTITSVTPLSTVYHSAGLGGSSAGFNAVSILLLGVMAICLIYKAFFRR